MDFFLTSPKEDFDELSVEMLVQEEGFAYIFLSNENPTQVDIHFDELTVVHKKTNVIQYNEYYPFGLLASTSWTRENSSNNFLYNAGNELNASSGWYDMFYRNYEPALGRMMQVDPYATSFPSYSPYNYSLNSPALLNDPSGGYVYANAAQDRINKIRDRNNPNYFSDWAESFQTPGMARSSDAEAVKNGTMSLEAYTAKYGTSISPVNFARYLHPDAMLYSLLVEHNGNYFAYDIIYNTLGNVSYASRTPQEAEGTGYYESGNRAILFDDRNFKEPTADLAGGVKDWAGLLFDAGDDMMSKVAANFAALQAESNALNFGLKYDNELSKATKAISILKWGGRVLGAYSAITIEAKYRNGEISKTSRALEQATNAVSTFGGVYGASWGVGWEIGRAITSIPAYRQWKHETWLPYRKSTLGY